MPCRGAIAFDAKSLSAGCGASPCAWVHVTGSISNGVLYAQISVELGTVTGCTYNSVAMTAVGNKTDGASVTSVYTWILVAPSSGSHSISCAGTGFGNGAYGIGSSYSGVAQTGTVGNTWRAAKTANDGGAQGATATIAVNNAVSGDMVVDAVSVYASGTNGTYSSSGGGQTLLEHVYSSGFAAVGAAASYEAATGSTTMTETFTGANYWADLGVALIPAGASAAVNCTMSLMGVGPC